MVDEGGQVVARDCVNIVYTVDERVTDGFCFVRSAEVLRGLLEEPVQLGEPVRP